MYKVLLVDDEILTRESISQNVPWNDIGFTLIGSAENGEEALQLVEKERPELVLTDICMPVMDGIALSKYLHDKHPETKVVIISGYDDFEYAKQAIKFGVSNYILKPITSCELMEELEKIRQKIERTLEKRREVEQIKPTLRNHFLARLLEGNYKKYDVDAQLHQLGIHLSGCKQAVVRLEVEDFTAFKEYYPPAGEELIQFAVANIAEEIAAGNERIVCYKSEANNSYFIFAGENSGDLYQLIDTVCKKMIDAVWRYMHTRVCAVAGNIVKGPSNWKRSYQSVLHAREYKFLFEGKEIIYSKDVLPAKGTEKLELMQRTDRLVLQIKLNQGEEIKNEAASLFLCLRESGKENKALRVIIQNLVFTILMTLPDHLRGIINEEDKSSFIMGLQEARQLSEIETQFQRFCIKLADNIAVKRESPSEKQAIRAMDYIEKNYMNAEMSLHTICDYLCVSASYFSAIFKKATGETFIEALTRIRIDKAKGFLESSDMKNYEVAMAVGYQDPHYFSSIFKKRVGMTPTKYAKQLKRRCR